MSSTTGPSGDVTLKSFEGKWRWAAYFAIYGASSFSSWPLQRLFGVPHSSGGSDPPWYYIRLHFFQGLGELIGLIVLLVLVAATWRRYTYTNWMLLMFGCAWLVPGVVKSIIIYSRCANFFDYEHAVCAWPTFEAYIESGVPFVGFAVGFVLIALLAVLKRWRERNKVAQSQ